MKLAVMVFLAAANLTAQRPAGRWVTGGPPGVANLLAVDPTRSGLLYASSTSQVSAAFKSTDSGSTWALAGAAPPGYFIRSLALDPSNTSILYATAVDDLWTSVFCNVYRSTDGGISWVLLASPADSVFEKLAVDPRSPEVIYAAGYSWVPYPGRCYPSFFCHHVDHPAVFRSTDGGRSWRSLLFSFPARTDEMLVDSGNPSELYASAADSLWQSKDRGETWTEVIQGGCLLGSTVLGRSDSEELVFFLPRGLGCVDIIQRSVDGGRTFSPWPAGALPGSSTGLVQGAFLVLDRSDADRMYLAYTTSSDEQVIARSGDGGRTWRELPPVPSKMNDLALDSSGRVLYAATNEGVYTFTLPAPEPPMLVPFRH